jgi:hypothetical protein
LYMLQWGFFSCPFLDDFLFMDKMRALIQPIEPIQTVHPFKDCISIALHIRRGGTFKLDTARVKKLSVARFAPMSYYVTALRYFCDLFQDKPLYIHVFTDDENPESLVAVLRESCMHPHAQFNCRHGKNSHNINVLEDLFSLMNFDCLIRPQSTFSIVAEILGNHALVSDVVVRSGRKYSCGLRIKEDHELWKKWNMSVEEIQSKMVEIPVH